MTSRGWRGPCCATGCCCGPKPSSSATGPTTRCRRRCPRCPSRADAGAPMDSTVIAGIAVVAAALIGLAVAPVSATLRTALLFGGCALVALAAPTVALFAAVAVAAAFVVDAVLSRPLPVVHRRLPGALARGVPSSLTLDAELAVEPPEADERLDAEVRARRRGRHTLPSPAARVRGPLGLAAWYRRGGNPAEVLVYPDLPAAWRLVLAVRQGRFRDPGRLTRGPLGLGTDFESIRDYLPDDDIRQVNWRATARLGRPMSNQYRVEQDRDVVCLLDVGRLMAAPLDDRTRLDATVDAATAVALVADEVGDRAGVIAFDDRVRRRLPPARGGGDAVVRAIFDVEPTMVDSDYELAFRAVGSGKRAFVLVLTDLDLEQMVHASPQAPADVYAAAVALDVLDARARVAAQLRRAGADVVEALPETLPAACVGAYLRAKARARL